MVLHKNLTTDHLHVPKAHTHVEADITDLDHTDVAAIHVDEAGEIQGIEAPSVTLADADVFLFEKSGASFEKGVVEFDKLAELLTVEAGGPFLPLIASHLNPLTGDLYVESASTPALYLDTGGSGVDYGFLQYNSGVTSLASRKETGNAVINIYPLAIDGVGDAHISLFNTTQTNGERLLRMYVGDGSSDVRHQFNMHDGDVHLCQDDGTLYSGGNIFIENNSFPQLQMFGEGEFGLDVSSVQHSTYGLILRDKRMTGDVYIDLEHKVDDNASDAFTRLYRNTLTTGDCKFQIMAGDGSDTPVFEFDAKTGTAYIAKLRGVPDRIDLEGVEFEGGRSFLVNDYAHQTYKADTVSVLDLIYCDSSDRIVAGDLQVPFYMRGSGARPKYAPIIPDAYEDLALLSDLDSYLPLTAGSGESLTGDLFIDSASTPKINMREGGSTTYYSILSETQFDFYLQKFTTAGDTRILLDPTPLDASSDGEVAAFRNVNTSGSVELAVHRGDGSANKAHQLFGSGAASLDVAGTSTITIGNILDVNGRVRLPYLGGAPTSLVNGDIWMESDGLHIYYAGAEKVVAGV